MKKEKMKKIYSAPEMELGEMEVASVILAGSDGTGTEGGSSSDTEFTGGDGGGANNPGFGGDY